MAKGDYRRSCDQEAGRRLGPWGRWFVSVVTLFQFAYRFRFWFPDNFEFPLLLVLLVALNAWFTTGS